MKRVDFGSVGYFMKIFEDRLYRDFRFRPYVYNWFSLPYRKPTLEILKERLERWMDFKEFK